MKMKVMLGLVAVSLLASCGLFKTTVQLPDTRANANRPVGGGALGIDSKGIPLSLSRTGLVAQVVVITNTVSGTFADPTEQNVKDAFTRVSQWGATQDMPTAMLSGTQCPNVINITNAAFSVTISDSANQPGVTFSATIPAIVFTAITAGSCEYNATIGGSLASISYVLEGEKLAKLKTILSNDIQNTAVLTSSFTNDSAVAGRTLEIKFGGSSSYVVAVVF